MNMYKRFFAIGLTVIASFSVCAIGSINDSINKQIALNKRTYISFPIEFKNISAQEAQTLSSKNNINLNRDLDDVFADWKDETCFKASGNMALKCANNGFNHADMLQDAIQFAKIDINKDGKRDLILYFGNKTGRAGMGYCGVAEYRFYQNTGKDFIPVGIANTTQNSKLYLLDNAKKGHFMSLVWKTKINCEGKAFNSETTQNYNISKKSY